MARRSKHSNRFSRSEKRYRSTKRKLRRITAKLDTLTQLMLKQSQTPQPSQTTQTTTQKETPMQQTLANLTEITSPRQTQNGTRAFLCNRTGAIYTSHSNGYVRRQMKTTKGHSGQYQINAIKNGIRIMIPNESDRLSLIEKRAAAYKA